MRKFTDEFAHLNMNIAVIHVKLIRPVGRLFFCELPSGASFHLSISFNTRPFVLPCTDIIKLMYSQLWKSHHRYIITANIDTRRFEHL